MKSLLAAADRCWKGWTLS